MNLLTEDFLSKYDDMPEHMTELGAFVFYRTYSRWIPSEGRRETWKEATHRAVTYSIKQSIRELEKKDLPVPFENIQNEAETLFDNIYNLRQFLSGRTHWVGGAESDVGDKFPLSNFNCAFVEINEWSDMVDLFYLLLVGTGVGFKSTKETMKNLKPVRNDVKFVHNEYVKRYPLVQEPDTKTFDTGDKLVVHIGDSKEGWVKALKTIFDVLTEEEYEKFDTISLHYDYIRPKGTRLKTFGGTASGHEPLMEMFQGIEAVINGTLDPSLEPPAQIGDNKVQLRPIHILDIGNLIGNNVVVGGVRRTAEIFLSDSDDWEVILAKYGINGVWDEAQHNKVKESLQNVLGYVPKVIEDIKLNDENARPLHHRRMSNNSVAFETKPSREMLNLIFQIMQAEGEPGFVNLEAAAKRRPNAKGINPCAEILLDSHGVCNLTTVNVDAFVIKEGDKWELDFSGLMQAQALSARAGVRMTLLDLELPEWDEVHKRDRLIGTSLTGWYDAMDKLGYNDNEEAHLLELLSECSRIEALKYSMLLRIPAPLLDTTVKPEGTLSQVAGGVSSGLHRSHSEYYIRRIRVNANDPLAKVAKSLDWVIHADVGTEGYNDVESLAREDVIEKADTIVIDFPVYSGAKTTKNDVTVKDQFDTYFRFQTHYTAHNASNTISVRPDEWEEAEQIVWDNWDDFIAVSFLAHDGGTYTLPPYEEITKEEYESLRDSMKSFVPEALQEFENNFLDKELAMSEMEGCEGGACPII